jgi:phage terminase large subunit-like protein
VAAVSKEQTRNTMTLFPSLFSRQAIETYSIDIGKEITYAFKGRNRLEAVTSSPRTLEGARSTFIVLNETQHWVDANDGTEMAKAARRNAAKVGGRVLAITNAHRIGENSVAEQDWEKYRVDGEAGEMLYDSTEAPEPEPKPLDEWTDDELRAGLLAARGDSVWVPIDRLMLDCRDTRDPEHYRRRFYLNQIRQETDTWIGAEEWKATERHEDVPRGTLIALGFDGSKWNDTTALVGTVVETGYQWVIRKWSKPDLPDEWEVPEDEVDMAVEEAFNQYTVGRFYADPYWWEETIARWMGRYGKDVVAFFHTNRQVALMTRTLSAYASAVRSKELGHEADPEFAAHISNAVKRDVNLRDENGDRLYTIGKEGKNSPRKIDIAMAAVLSWAARNAALAAGMTGGESVYETRGFLSL